jgi:hypothetical protein
MKIHAGRTQTRAGKCISEPIGGLKFFVNLSGLDKTKEEEKYRFDIIVYEGHKSWHTRYKLFQVFNSTHFFRTSRSLPVCRQEREKSFKRRLAKVLASILRRISRKIDDKNPDNVDKWKILTRNGIEEKN